MKKLLSGLLALTLCLGLSACGGGDNTAEDQYVPAEVATALNDSAAFSEALTQLDTQVACELYGIDAAGVKEGAVYGSTGATAEEFAVFTFDSGNAADAALSALQTRVSDRIEALKSYQPNEVGKLEGALTEKKGNSVLLVVASDYDAANKALGK